MKPPTFEEAFAAVKKLAEDFDANKQHFLSAAYQESEVRTDFINKFLIALGWDVNHDWQKNPLQQEVKVERSVSMGTSQRKADYAFYIAPHFRKDDVRFFVEAKKPFGDIATPDNCFQTVRYGWNAGTPVAALTDFEQFQILDCRYKPHIDTVCGQVVRKYHYGEYANPEKFAEIFYLFSREAVAGGSLEQFSETLPKKRGKAGVASLLKAGTERLNDSFLADLDEYRDTLAHVFKNNNPALEGETLTEITQRTLDRLVFMRFLEDKLIYPEHLVANFGHKTGAWQDFVAASRKLDGIYNGIVFKRHAFLDAPEFKVDDAAFADICKQLSHRQTSYLFDLIPIHILGSIYERFLGKVIVTTDKRARVEEKPEVRKAGGVYYTPEYIVRYIVENTVGKLIEGKTPAQIAEMRFADIACGSGSFLLGVYDLLLQHHLEWFNANPDKAKKAGCVQREDGAWHLSLKQRREILLNNIYGVDIDHQAVEVAQLSLYLKLLEEETTGTTREYQLEFHETLLPSLNKNIVCGNSLIGTDISTGELFEIEEERKLNPMDFEQRFPHIFRRRLSTGELKETPALASSDYTLPGVPLHGSYSYKKIKGVKAAAPPPLLESEFEGGFDAIVGNPPYIQLSMEAFRDETANRYLRETYKFSGGRLNTFTFFIERARQKTREGGKFAYIVPNTVLSQEYYADLRQKLIQHTDINAIAIPDGQIFKDAVVETVVLVLTKHTRRQDEKPKGKVEFITLRETGLGGECNSISQSELADNYKASFIIPLNREVRTIRDKLEKHQENFGRWLNVNQAIALKHDRAACLTDSKKTTLHREVLDGRHIGRYVTGKSPNYFKFDVSKIHSCKREDIFLLPEKIFFRRVGDSLIASIDTQKKFALNTLVVMSPKPDCPYNLRYMLALFNSKLLNFYYVSFLKSSKKVFSEIQARQVEQMPVPSLNLSEVADKSRHDRLVALVEQMLAAQKQLAGAQSDADKDFYGNKCAGLDRQIDALVYELYGLTPEEIKIVEGVEK